MRKLFPIAAALSCCLAFTATAQKPQAGKTTPAPVATTKPVASAPAARPQFRPAVLRTGAESLVNRIRGDELKKKGQKDGAVQFSVLVRPDGSAEQFLVYHALSGSEALENEVAEQLEGAQFTPPIYEHQPVRALLTGTVLFAADESAHIRIFLNQDPREIEERSDFIAPQPVIGGDSKFAGLRPLEGLPVKVIGVATVGVRVDEKGAMLAGQVLNEEPPLIGLAAAVTEDIAGAKFIPPFRDGDVVASEVVMSFGYRPADDEPTSDSSLNLQQASPTPAP